MTTATHLLIDHIAIHLTRNPTEREIQQAAEDWAYQAFTTQLPCAQPMSLDAVCLRYDKLFDDAERAIRDQLSGHVRCDH